MVTKMARKKKSVMGAPTKYDPKYCQQMVDYFSQGIYSESKGYKKDKEYNEFPTFQAFANKIIGVCTKTLDNWTKEHNDFLQAYNRCKELQEHILLQGGLNRAYDSRFAMFILNSVSKTFREKVEHTVDDSAKNLIKLAYSLPSNDKDD